MTQNTQSSVEIDREIFFLCSALINKKTQMVRQYDGVNPKWRGDTHTSYRCPAGGFIQGSELKGPGYQLEKRRSRKLFGSFFLLWQEIEWETNKKQLRNAGSKNTRLFSILTAGTRNLESNKNARGRKWDGNFNDHSCMRGQRIPMFPGNKGYLLWVVLILRYRLSLPLPCFSLPLPLCILLHAPLPQFLFSLSISIINKYIHATKWAWEIGYSGMMLNTILGENTFAVLTKWQHKLKEKIYGNKSH